MIAAVTGRTFLNAFNKKNGVSLSAKEFFNEYYFKQFFDYPKYMQWVTNSPFVQMKAGQKPHLLSTQERIEKLTNLHTKILEGKPEASIAIGFPASEESEFASTSGLVSDIPVPADAEEVYLSWIGSGLGLGVAGGYSIFFNEPEILLKIYEGWAVYRKYLNMPSLEKLRGNQINTWNGQWLNFVYNPEDYREHFDFNRLERLGIFEADTEKIEVNTVLWTKLFFSISHQYPNATFTGYIYSLGQTNKTIGFIPFQCSACTTIKETYKKLFAPGEQIGFKDFETLFGIHVKRACELGSIGLQALRPDKLKAYFGSTANLSFKKDEDKLLYHAFKTWLVAMLSKNKEDITGYTQNLAEAMHRYRAEGTKTDRKNLLDNILSSKSKKGFLEGLVQIIKDARQDDLPSFKTLRDEIHLMTNDEYGYFVTLLKFDYAYQDRNIKN